MKISRKLKIGGPLPDPPFPSLLPPVAMKTAERKGLKRRRRICMRTRCWKDARKEGGKMGYDMMSGMLYDPIFQIIFCAFSYRRSTLIPLLSCSLFYIGHPFLFPEISLSLYIYISFPPFCSPKFGSHVHPPQFVFAYCKIVRLISRELFDPRTEI